MCKDWLIALEVKSKTHCSFSLCHLGLFQSCFTGIQVQAQVLQEASFFLVMDERKNKQPPDKTFFTNNKIYVNNVMLKCFYLLDVIYV